MIIPSPENSMSLSQIANKDVPQGLPYKIINSSDIPTDRIFRNAWTFDFTNPDGYGGAI
jgi:hypothetical protein